MLLLISLEVKGFSALYTDSDSLPAGWWGLGGGENVTGPKNKCSVAQSSPALSQRIILF